MRVTPSLTWSLDTDGRKPIDPRLVDLLARIAATGSLRAACQAAAIPYRTAWGLLQAIEQVVGSPLVELRRGRGASLTADGAALVRADAAARQRMARESETLAFEISGPSARENSSPAHVLRIAASHDPALAALQDALPAATGARLSIAFCGSLDALARFKTGQVDVAGFHFVPGKAATAKPYLLHLRPARDRLVRFVDREQGLIVAHGNPKRVHCLSDVARRKLRFVNRQPGSGTRLLIDAQLAQEGLDPSVLRGYASVEFTHAAVAATIAAGRADAGIGVAAAAAEYDLGFVPLVRERYYFAVRAAALRSSAIVALRTALKGPIFIELVGQMAGYDARHSGELEPIPGRTRSRTPRLE